MASPTTASPTTPTPTVTYPPFFPAYPYIFTRTYLCGHPPERTQVTSLSEKRLEHTILPIEPRTHLPLPETEFTLERCRKCATIDRATNLDIARRQGMTDRPPGQKRDGFMDVLSRYAVKRKDVGVVMHEAMEEDDPEEDDIYVVKANASGRQHYERALRSIGRSVRAVDELPLAERILRDIEEEGRNSPDPDPIPVISRRPSLPKLNTNSYTWPLQIQDPDLPDTKPRSKTFPLGREISQHSLSDPIPFSRRRSQQISASPAPSSQYSVSNDPIEPLRIAGRSFTTGMATRAPEHNSAFRNLALRRSIGSVGSTGSDETKETDRSGGSGGSDKGKMRMLFGRGRAQNTW